MTQVYTQQRTTPVATVAQHDYVIAILTFLFIAFFAFLGLYQLTPPSAVHTNAPVTDFSSGRAMKHIEAIARSPRPIGSPGA